jgi:ABC-2 type transport system ATP-binding protein
VWEALDLFASASAVGADWRDTARQWGIDHRRDAAFANLSGGERQRLFIALALIAHPEIVFLDEMTTGLDPAARRVAWSLIKSVREQGATIVLVTHFMDEVERLCDRVAVFKRGRVLEVDSPNGLVARFARERTVRFSAASGDLGWLAEVPGVSSVERDGAEVAVRGEGAVLARVAAALVARGVEPPDLRVELATLEDAYMGLVEEAPA